MDTTTTSNKLIFEMTLQKGSDQSKRTISFETYLPSASKRANAVAFANKLVNGEWKWAFQPTGWRDDDDTEEAWQVISLVAKAETTTTTEIDPDSWAPDE